MSFNIVLGYITCPKYQVEKTEENEAVVDIATYTGELKSETSIIDPVILIECDLADVRKANYMRIPGFGRKYFINNIRSVRTGLVAFECHVDVLASFADAIKENYGLIRRNENEWNLLLNDGVLKVYQNPHVVLYEFPNGFTEQEFVLAMAGS